MPEASQTASEWSGRGVAPRIAIIWHRLGPYHRARARAAARLAKVVIIEMSSEDNTYAWTKIAGDGAGFEMVTVFKERDCDDEPPRLVRSRLQAVLDQIKPDVLFIPSWGKNYAIAALEWSMRRRVPRVVFSESAEIDKPRKPWFEWIKSQIVGNFQVALVGGERHLKYMEQLGVPRRQIWTGYNCVDNAHFATGAGLAVADAASMRHQLGLPARYFLTAARFIAKKNLSTLLKAFARFVLSEDKTSMPIHLVLLGDGAQRSELERLTRELALADRVLMPGFKQYDQTPAYYGLAEAFVLPSLEEQWGLVVNEAMAAGLPVLVSNRCNCAVELVREGKNGFTFDPLDVAGMAEVIKKFATLSSEARAAMGRESQTIVTGFEADRFGQSVVEAAAAARSIPMRSTLFSRLLLPLLARQRNAPDY